MKYTMDDITNVVNACDASIDSYDPNNDDISAHERACDAWEDAIYNVSRAMDEYQTRNVSDATSDDDMDAILIAHDNMNDNVPTTTDYARDMYALAFAYVRYMVHHQ